MHASRRPTGTSSDTPPGAPVRPAHWPTTWKFRWETRPVELPSAMVCTTDRYATEVGVAVLRGGGNAVDATVAVAFALAVVNPEAGNVGGSGFLLVRTADGESAALDFRGKAPLAASRDMFLDEQGELTERSEVGHLAAAIPGSVRGLWDAHRRFGKLPWEVLVQPAIDLAHGFVVEDRFLRSFAPHIVEGLRRFPTSVEIFLPGGLPPKGVLFRQLDLARTLVRIRDGGADGFYRGETADLIVAEMERGGGIIKHEDLDSYTSKWREPLRFGYRGYTALSMPLSSSGGVTMAETAHILARFPLGELPWHGPEHIHLLAEAWKRAYGDRNHYLADPDFVDVPVESLISPRYGAWRAEGIRREVAGASRDVHPGVGAYEGEAGKGETTHVSIVDAEGMAVSLTTTLNTWYGSKVVVAGTGVLLNNEMDDFSAKPGVPNHFGLVQGEANAIEPGKRMLSAMTPTIVLAEDRLFLVVGTPGGATIITTVFQVLSNLVDHGMGLAQAVVAPRIHHQHLPDRIWFEPGGVPSEVVRQLSEMGHDVAERDELLGDVQAILVGPRGGLQGIADPRRGGTALGF